MDAPWAPARSRSRQTSFEHRVDAAAVVLGLGDTEANQADVLGERVRVLTGAGLPREQQSHRQVERIVISEEINRSLSKKGLEEGGGIEGGPSEEMTGEIKP